MQNNNVRHVSITKNRGHGEMGAEKGTSRRHCPARVPAVPARASPPCRARLGQGRCLAARPELAQPGAPAAGELGPGRAEAGAVALGWGQEAQEPRTSTGKSGMWAERHRVFGGERHTSLKLFFMSHWDIVHWWVLFSSPDFREKTPIFLDGHSHNSVSLLKIT